VEKKQFGFTFLFWLIGGAIGAHRIYETERAHFILWYWILNACTFGILAIVDLFLIQGRLKEWNRKVEQLEDTKRRLMQ
jgi:TM2 domain-containing membrane protein YozV